MKLIYGPQLRDKECPEVPKVYKNLQTLVHQLWMDKRLRIPYNYQIVKKTIIILA